MSHELRTPLNGILGYARILKREPALTERQHDGLDIIESSGKHLLDLINDVLDLSKVEAGKVELHLSDFYLSTAITNVADMVRMKAQRKGLDFRLDLPDSLPAYVRGDERHLRQILLNLLGNAVKFTEQGSVTLRVETHSGEALQGRPSLRFTISDTGIGIAPDDLDAVFEPFRQSGDMVNRAKGTGLGLAISRNLIRLMGGELTVTSRLGAGSVFAFEIDLPPVAQQDSPHAERPAIIGIEGPAPTILVADDNAPNRSMLRDLLTPLGVAVVEARDGQEALTRMSDVRPDVILTDLLMPGMTGVEFIQALRRSADFRAIPIIAMSASVYEEDRQRSLNIGADAFLPKPIEIDRLLELLGQFPAISWTYAEKDAGDADREPAVIPPKNTLIALLQPAMIGDLEDVQNELDKLSEAEPQYRAFIDRVMTYVRQFKVDDIVELLEQYLAG